MLTIALEILLLLNLATAFRAHHVKERNLGVLVKRQGTTSTCPYASPGPSRCARACGQGFILCPGGGETYCFNPGRGDTCCQDGGYCAVGTYCANFPDGSAGCCFNNQTLSQCGAVAKGATIAGGSSSSSSSPVSSSSTSPGGGSSISPGGSSSTSPGGGSSTSPGGRTSPLQPSSPQSNPVPSSSGSVICKPVDNPTCERSCGPGWVTCQELPHCYNPGLKQTCCSDGSYCPAGSSCSPGGCCPDGQQCSGGSASSAINASPSQVVIPTTQGVTYTYTRSHHLTLRPGQTTGTQLGGPPHQGTSSQAAQSTVAAGMATTDFHLAFDAVAVFLTTFGILLL